jgi:asparagine synthase (glutamine-hydrolysing)
MTGFSGYFYNGFLPTEIDLLKCLQRRGKDGFDRWQDEDVMLAAALNRTTWESAKEKQPFGGEGVWVVADALLDAKDVLVADLRDRRISLDLPDVELIWHAYCVWGEDCWQHLTGDFAAAIWDSRRRLLCLGRDRLGVRSLYYGMTPAGFYFGNDLPTVRSQMGISELNDLAIGDFLLFGNCQWLDKCQTAFAGIEMLPAASCAIVEDGKVAVRRYWEFPEVALNKAKSEDAVCEEFRYIFALAVGDRLRADRVGILLSGGLDSSTIAATALEVIRNSGKEIKLLPVTAYFAEVHPDREREYVELLTRYLGIESSLFSCDPYPLLDPYIASGEPQINFTPANQRDIFQLVASKSPVMLNGRGGDNLFPVTPLLGSSIWREQSPVTTIQQYWQFYKKYQKMPPIGTGLTNWQNKISPKIRSTYPYPTWLQPELEKQLNLPDRWQFFWQRNQVKPNFRHRHDRHEAIVRALTNPVWTEPEFSLNLDFTPPEGRDPFFDIRVIQFILSLPPLPWLPRKYLLRRSMVGKLPPEILNRPKTPIGYTYQSIGKHYRDRLPDLDRSSLHPNLTKYIDIDRLPSLEDCLDRPTELFITLRAYILNYWLNSGLVR